MYNIQNNISAKFSQVKNLYSSFPMMATVFSFFKLEEFLPKLFKKSRGVSVFEIFSILFAVMMKDKRSTYAGLCSLGEKSRKTTVNDFLNAPFHKWRELMFYVAKIFTMRFKPDKGKPNVVIIDDSPRPKTGERCEHVSRLTNHTDMSSYIGYEFVAAVWSNLRSCIPLDFVIKTCERLKSSKRCAYPDGSHTQHRYRESRLTKLEICINMLKRILKHGIKFSYVLWDSAYNSCATLKFVLEVLVPKDIHLVTRLGLTDEKYLYKKKRPNLEQIYISLTNWEKITLNKEEVECASVIVGIEDKYKKRSKKRKKPGKNNRGTYIRNTKKRAVLGSVKIFFIRTPYKKAEFQVVMSTNLKLSVAEAFELYKFRWGIESFFENMKSYYGFHKAQSSKYAPQIADLSIKCSFYTMMCIFRERSPNKSMYQILFSFAYEFEIYCRQKYHEFMLINTVSQILDFVGELGIKTIKQFKNNLTKLTVSFLQNNYPKLNTT